MIGVARWPASLVLGAILGVTVLVGGPPGAAAATPDGDIVADGVVCDTATHEYVLTWVVSNYIESRGVSVTQVAGTGTLTYTATKGAAGTAVPSSFILDAATLNGATDVITPTQAWIVQRLPGTTKSAALSSDFTWFDGTGGPVSGSTTLAGTCVAAKPAPVAHPAAAFRNACNGTVRITLTDAVAGAPPVVFTVTAGTSQQSVTVAANQTRTVTIPARSATSISVHASGFDKGPVAWSAPAGCPSPTTTPGGTGGPVPAGNPLASTAPSGDCPTWLNVAILKCGDDPAVAAKGSPDGELATGGTSGAGWLPLVAIGTGVLLLLAALLIFWLVSRRDRREATEFR